MGILDEYLQWVDKWIPGLSRPDHDNARIEQCARCGERIKETYRQCPACGNFPGKRGLYASLIVLGGGVLVVYFVPLLGAILIALGVVSAIGAQTLTAVDVDL